MKKLTHKILAIFIGIIAIFPSIHTAKATVPEFIIYEGRLLSSGGSAITTPHDFRFSLWQSSDFTGTDIAAGSINTGAANYAGWQEWQTVTPTSTGVFSLKLGNINALPDLDFALHKFLQVEVKKTTDPNTGYQLMDPTGDNGADTNDRKTIGSLPYALNAYKSELSDRESFTIDADDTINTAGTGSVKMQFGTVLNKILEYDLDNTYFNFNDDVNIQGDLTLTGLINGINIVALAAGTGTSTGTTSDTFEVNTDGNSVMIDTAGLTGDINVTFNDADTIVVGENNSQVLTNKTIDGDNNTITNIDQSSLKNQNKTMILTPEYNNLTIHQDGTLNFASIYQGLDTANGHQYYLLKSQEGTLQDLDLEVTVPIPDDFQGWQATPMQINVRSTTTDFNDNHIDITVIDSSGTPVVLTGGNDLSSSTADNWILKDITFGGSPTFTAGSVARITLKMQSHSDNNIYAGEIILHYIGK